MQPIRVGGLAGAGRQDLDDAAVELAQRSAERDTLLVVRQPRRHRLALRPRVRRRVGGAPAPRALLHRETQHPLHVRDLVGRRVAIPRGLVHGAEAERIVTDERHHVGAEPDVDRVEELAEGLPRPRQHGAERPHGQIFDAAEGGEHRVAMLGPERR